jgi:hypothetical protein
VIVCDIFPGAYLACFNHLLERLSRLEKDRSHGLNIPESIRAWKDNFCGNARTVAGWMKEVLPAPDKKIKPLYPVAEGLLRGSQIVKISFMFFA